VLARQDEPLDDAVVNRFERAVSRRLTGEPVAYILGVKEFYGRPFQVDNRVLIPRPETEHLVEVVLELPRPQCHSLLEIGTGSGCLACTLALEIPGSRVTATDLSIGALAVARGNLKRHDLTDRLQLIATDLAVGVDLAHTDLVISNPPYIGRPETDSLSSEILDFEPHSALFAGAAGDEVHRRLLDELAGLPHEAWLVMEIGASQEEPIRHLSAQSPFSLLEVRPDYAGHPRVAVLRRR